MITIGIDPGKNGGIAYYTCDTMFAVKMPSTLDGIWDILKNLGPPSIYATNTVKAYIEQVSSSPQMGVVSAFSFGQGFGHLEMALTAAGIRFERVRPQVWQKSLGCLTKGNKNITKNLAQDLFPHIKVTHSIADALLICEYGRKQQ